MSKFTVINSSDPSRINKSFGGQESYADKFLRGAVRTGSRALETVVGLPGDVANLGFKGANYLTGGFIPTRDDIEKNNPGVFPPTSQELRQISSDISGGYTEPRGSGEEFYDDVISDLTALALPGAKSPKSLLRLAGIATAGNVAQRGAKGLGFGALGQTAAKLGTMGIAGLIGGRSKLKETMLKSYALQEEATAGKQFSSKKLRASLNKAANELSHQDFPAKEFISDRINHLGNLIDMSPGGKVPVQSIVAAKRGLNEWFSSGRLPFKAQQHLYRVREPIMDFLKDYSRTDPIFAKHFYQAEDIFKGLNNYSTVASRIKSVADLGHVKNIATKKIFSLLGFTKLFGHGGTLAAASAVSTATSEGIKFLNLVMKSKQAREAYFNLLQSALHGTPQSINRNIQIFDKEVGKKLSAFG